MSSRAPFRSSDVVGSGARNALDAGVQLALSTPAASTPLAVASPALNVHALGMNLDAATTVDGRDRKRLERLCRYLLRPRFASDAVHWLPDGRV